MVEPRGRGEYNCQIQSATTLTQDDLLLIRTRHSTVCIGLGRKNPCSYTNLSQKTASRRGYWKCVTFAFYPGIPPANDVVGFHSCKKRRRNLRTRPLMKRASGRSAGRPQSNYFLCYHCQPDANVDDVTVVYCFDLLEYP